MLELPDLFVLLLLLELVQVSYNPGPMKSKENGLTHLKNHPISAKSIILFHQKRNLYGYLHAALV
ncbi:hypothetical protein AXF42_Ash003345 [Apostasia shenzhenica]|uniref:Uncharacterized protein n=1 Tax=Apostasia shenzhenica TaxID=1088818 RepID=A0A2I0BFV9_9ASPA|nr:hypothetical protein AXF42_Ash003345 [Apostasia shenzhenica]